jgi:hypothetical protein
MHSASTSVQQRTFDELFDVVAAVRRRLNDVFDLLERLVVHPQPPREWATAEEAASLIGRSVQAIRKRFRTHNIGVRVNGRWKIDRSRI